jgi:dGTPase
LAAAWPKWRRNSCCTTTPCWLGIPAKDLINLTDAEVQEALIQAKELASNKVYRHAPNWLPNWLYPALAILDVLIPAVHAFITRGQSS